MLVLITALLILHFWSTAGALRFSREPGDYYNLQTAGFLHGHLYAAVEPHPGLLALADPYDPVANAPYRMHDMSFWQGKYYLYFGVAPVLLLFLPVRLLTGYFVSEPTAVALFVSLGGAFSCLALVEMRARLFPRAGRLVLGCLLAAQGLAAPTVLLVQSPQFYQVPTSCAYALGMAGLWCLLRLLTTGPDRRGRWLVAAGACFGATLAARPNYILAMGLLAVPLWWCWREAGLLHAPAREKMPLGVRIFGPVAAVGAGLLFFNWARFGQPTEFGMRYQLAGQSFLHFSPLGWEYLGPHLREYVWGKIWWQPYFPFLDLGPDAPYGVLRYLPLTWLGLVACWPWRLPGDGPASRRQVLAWAVAILGAANLVMNSVFFFAPVTRYLSDFAPALVLLGAMGGLALAHAFPRPRLAAGFVAGVALWSMAVTTGVFIYRQPAAAYPDRVARLANRGVGWLQQLQGKKLGGIRVAMQLPAGRTEGMDPVFQTGSRADRRDWLELHYRGGGRAQLGFFHAGLGELLGEEFPLPADGRLVLDVYASAFLPPESHPLFAGWPADAIAAALCKLEIRIGGQPVLAAALPCYPSRPSDLLLGRAGFLPFTDNQVAAGPVTLVAELAAGREPLAARELRGVTAPLAVQLQLPAQLDHGYEPLIATGESGRGELLYVIYSPGHRVQFGLDSWGQGPVLSRVLGFDPTKPHVLTAWLGSWATGGDSKKISGGDNGPPGPDRLFVKLDDTVVFNAVHTFFPGQDSPTALGWNRIGSGSAAASFSGRMLSVGPAPGVIAPEMVPTGVYGAVNLWVRLPKESLGRTQPLVVTGAPGAGDAFFIKYLDGRQVVFGHDHWGQGGTTSEPVPVDYDEPVHVEISLGSLYPPPAGPWSRKLWLKVNGRQILDEAADFFPARPEQISVGANAIGCSSCEPEFTGTVVSETRPATPE